MTNQILGEFGAERAPDDYDDDLEPEWLEFKPQEKKFDFSKQVPLKKMFGGKAEVLLESLEDEDDMTETTIDPGIKTISIEELERQQMQHFEQKAPDLLPFVQQKPAQNQFQPSHQQNNQSLPGHGPIAGMPFSQQPSNQPSAGGPPFGMPNQNSFGMPSHNEFSGPFGQLQQNDGFGFPGGDPFSGFGQPLDNPTGFGDSMGFGNSVFGAPFSRDEEFEKIFGQPSQQQNQGFFPSDDSKQPDMGGMFGFNQDQFMSTQNDDEDDWLEDDQFQDKQLDFIDQHHDTPIKGRAEYVKPDEVIESYYKFSKTDRKREPKPRMVHKFAPKLRAKKRFEKLFDKTEEEVEEETQAKKTHQKDLNLALIMKFWDMREEPSDLELLNLIQNPFSYHLVHRSNTAPQFYLNKDGPIRIGELFMWFNQGLVPKTFQVGHDES